MSNIPKLPCGCIVQIPVFIGIIIDCNCKKSWEFDGYCWHEMEKVANIRIKRPTVVIIADDAMIKPKSVKFQEYPNLEFTNDWKEVSEFEGNYKFQEVNDGHDEITRILVRMGPICDCGRPMILSKCFIRERKTKQNRHPSKVETECDIDSYCEDCNTQDSAFFHDKELAENKEWEYCPLNCPACKFESCPNNPLFGYKEEKLGGFDE